MSQNLLADASFLSWLLAVDQDLAKTARLGNCPFCGKPIHTANYDRKPHGAAAALPRGFQTRFSFCCSRDGCRRRVTPTSVRFLGRRVYLGAVVVLASVLEHGLTPARATELYDLFEVDRRTVLRWVSWWRTTFACTPFWAAARARLLPPPGASQLPEALLNTFLGELPDRVRSCLKFLLPITSASAPPVLAL